MCVYVHARVCVPVQYPLFQTSFGINYYIMYYCITVTDDGVLSQPYPVDPNAVLGSSTWAAFNISMKWVVSCSLIYMTKIITIEYSPFGTINASI